MTMILQLLVAAMAVGLGIDANSETTPYKEYLQSMKESSETMENNVLSMEGNLPLLNDSRRHYAEIVHVVNYHAIAESGGVLFHYNESYPIFLNKSAPQAINDPDEVINYIRKIKAQVHNNIDELKELIDACVQEASVCNELIDDTVAANQDQYGVAAKVLIAAGRAAGVLNSLNGEFEKWSNSLLAHAYVCSHQEDLEQIVWTVANLHRAVNGPCVGTALQQC